MGGKGEGRKEDGQLESLTSSCAGLALVSSDTPPCPSPSLPLFDCRLFEIERCDGSETKCRMKPDSSCPHCDLFVEERVEGTSPGGDEKLGGKEEEGELS